MTPISEEELRAVSKWIYEATRVEAEWSKRPIVPEAWEERDDKFRKQFVDIIGKYMSDEKLPTPEEAHDSWTESYLKMGWKYGETRDVEEKTHPDMVPFNELPQAERDKDAIFLAFVWLAKQFESLITTAVERAKLDVLNKHYKHFLRYEVIRKMKKDELFELIATIDTDIAWDLAVLESHREEKDA